MEDNRTPLSSHVLRTEACPKCGSPDNVKAYDDGHKKCWSGGCGYFDIGDELRDQSRSNKMSEAQPVQSTVQPEVLKEPIEAFDRSPKLEARHIEGETCKKFGVYRGKHKGTDVLVHPIYDQKGELAYQKVRVWGKKEFFFVKMRSDAPKPEACKMHGQQTYGEKFNKTVTIAVGEFDWLSLAEGLPSGGAFVSVVAGDDMILANLRANYLWLDSFDTIRLWFDNDTSGMKNLDDAAKLFKVGKVKIIKVEGYKDANALYIDKGATGLTEAFWSATTWRPQGLVNALDCAAEACSDDISSRGWEWPWPKLNEMTMGLRAGDVCYVVAGTGVGKTTMNFEIEHCMIKQGARLLIMGFEDTRRAVMLGLMTVEASVRFSTEETTVEQRKAAHEAVFGGGNVVLFDPDTAEWTMDAIIGYIRYAAKALNINVAVIDPLTFVAALSGGDGGNSVAALDLASSTFALIAKELGISIIIAHHLKRVEGKSHEEGGQTSLSHIRGSGGLANFATYVFGLERNQQSEEGGAGEDESGDGDNSAGVDARIRILKNRPKGEFTGLADVLEYDPLTGRLHAKVHLMDRGDQSLGRIEAQRNAILNVEGSQF